MKKYLLIIIFITSSSSLFAQKYFTRTGAVTFNASVGGFEPVEATNPNTTAILDISTGELAALPLVKGFKFDIALMEEHFNESYAESDKYSKAKFSGKINSFSSLSLSSKPQKITISGNLSFHGVSKNIYSSAQIYKHEGAIYIKGSFVIKASDYGIKIGSSVAKKVSDNVNVKFNFILNKK